MHVSEASFQRTEKGGIWTPTAPVDSIFVPPASGTHDPELTQMDLYRLGVAANEVVNAAWSVSVMTGLSEEDLRDPRAMRPLGPSSGLITKEGDRNRNGISRIPAIAQLGDISLYGVGGQRELEGYNGVRIDFEEDGETRTVRSAIDWAVVDGEPLDADTYHKLMQRMVVGEEEDAGDNPTIFFEELLDFVRPPRVNMTNHALIIDGDQVTEIAGGINHDPRLLDKSDRPDKFGEVLVKRTVGLADPDEFVNQYGTSKDSESSDGSTMERIMVVAPNQVIGLRKPLNNRSTTSYRLLDTEEDISQTTRDLSDLISTMVITDIAGRNGLVGTPTPLIIDRRGSGIGIRHDLSDTVSSRMRLLGVSR